MTQHGRSLRELVSDGLLMVPGIHDALGARAAQRAGFEAVSVSGNGVSASLLGAPDIGLLTMTEMVDHTRRIVDSVAVPVIADGDTGYGGPLNVVRTITAYEEAGAAAVHIEDQVHPKRCAYGASGVAVVSLDEAKSRVAAALDARRGDDFVIIARTDARASLGLEETVRRCVAYAQLGADWIFCGTLDSLDEARAVAAEVPAPLVVNLNLAGALADATPEQLRGAGVSVALYPSVVRNAAVKVMTDALTGLRAHGSQRAIEHLCATPGEYDDLLDTEAWEDLERGLSGES